MTTIVNKNGRVWPLYPRLGSFKCNGRNSSKRNVYTVSKRHSVPVKTISRNPIKEEPYPLHRCKGGHECVTDSIGMATPKGRSITDLRLDASNGIIPLWDVNVTLNYRFQERTLQNTRDPEETEETLRSLLSAALDAWGDAAPIRFKESDDAWDFEIAVRNADDRNVLASSFFPDAGQHELLIYPAMFRQSEKEQVDTLIHEIGHVFGLRHFFAATRERAFPSVLWGTKSRFSIMNYENPHTIEEESTLTDTDLYDLSQLYELVWSKQLRKINGTPIVLFRPFHSYIP
ncbi:hypothetical protein BGZ82_007667 [Podila clonocystis]|nr:hypothetical protein BGZ82_007667 [Podila clonocystis]